MLAGDVDSLVWLSFLFRQPLTKEGAVMADLGAYLFLIALFGVLFGLPIWLIIRHHKKSKAKLEQLKSNPIHETHTETAKRKRSHYESVFGVMGIVAGVLIGSRLLGNVLLGFVLGIIFAVIGATLASMMWRADREDTDDQ